MKIEERLEDIEDDVKLILENHLPTINVKIAVLITQVGILMLAMAYLIFGGTP